MEYYLIVSTILMFVGIYGFITRRNLLAMLISVELILNSVDINFVVFNRYLFPEQLEGLFFTLFAICISACETAVAIAIIINIYRNIRNIQASWLTVGKATAQIALHCGANDFGSIMIEENVVSSAGAHNSFDANGIQKAIREAGFTPQLRDQLYRKRELPGI